MSAGSRSSGMCRTAILLGSILLLSAPAAVGQQPYSSSQRPELPQSADAWINSVPLSYDDLKGKGVVFWYFEEQCPNCAAKWPSLKELAAGHATEPVLFVAVNSGNDPEALNRYVRLHRVDWPVLVDESRAFEKASDVTEISLQNITQVRILTPDGKFRPGRWDDLQGSVSAALKDARWTVDPGQFAAAACDAARCVEFGDYAAAIQKIRIGYREASPETKPSFKQLADLVNERFAAAWREASQSVDPADKWEAYQVYESIVRRFEGLPLPKEADAVWNALSSDPEVRAEASAMKLVGTAERQLQSEREDQRRRAQSRLQSAIKRFPQTEAAERARQLLAGQ